METSLQSRARLKKKPHRLHLCSSVDELIRELGAHEIDLLSLVHEFVKPSTDLAVLVTGSLTEGVATEVSDLDVLVLLPGADALKAKRTREIAGNPVNYIPLEKSNMREVSLFLAGIETDIIFVINPAIGEGAGPENAKDDAVLKEGNQLGNRTFLNRLATGWIVHGEEVAERWRRYYGTDKLRTKWVASEFTIAAKTLEDMEAGIGKAKGHVSMLGMYTVSHLLRTLLAANGFFCTSPKWMPKLEKLLGTVDPEMRKLLVQGRELVFPPLLEGVEEQRAYFERVHEYSRAVRDLLAREEEMADVLASIIHDLDIIL